MSQNFAHDYGLTPGIQSKHVQTTCISTLTAVTASEIQKLTQLIIQISSNLQHDYESTLCARL